MSAQRSDPNAWFWAEEAKRIAWMKAPSTKIKNTSFTGNVSIAKWFEDVPHT